jgi:hypothetical protein
MQQMSFAKFKRYTVESRPMVNQNRADYAAMARGAGFRGFKRNRPRFRRATGCAVGVLDCNFVSAWM